MASCTFENLTPEQAKVLAEWFEGAGEQDCEIWFEDRSVKSPMTHCGRPGGYREIKENGDAIVYCK